MLHSITCDQRALTRKTKSLTSLIRPLVLCVVLFITTSTAARNLSRWDALMNWNFMALPYASYAPETNWQFGVAAVYFFKTDSASAHINDANLDASYTLNHQGRIALSSRIYFNDRTDGYIDASVSYQFFPYNFFGIGGNTNSLLSAPYNYTMQGVDAQARPMFHFTKHWLAGPTLRFFFSDIPNTPTTDSIATQYNISGFGRNMLLGIGGSLLYDSRTNNYYPLNGIFFRTSATYFAPLTDKSSHSALLAIDYRHFVPIYKEFIFAYNIKCETIVSQRPPFQLMPTIGGQDAVRGVQHDRFKDKVMLCAQAEFRIPIWRFLKATAFCSVGDVYDYNNWTWQTPKIGYGVGLRACIHKAKTNLRFDVARQNYGNNWSFYFTLKEAF